MHGVEKITIASAFLQIQDFRLKKYVFQRLGICLPHTPNSKLFDKAKVKSETNP